MIELDTVLSGVRMEKSAAEDFLKPRGFTVGGGWDYDHGYYDYVFRKKPHYDVLRIPVAVKGGDFEQPSAVLEIGKPIVLRHKYQTGIEEEKDSLVGIGAGTLNQFQSPIEKDADVDHQLVDSGMQLINLLEQDYQKFLQ
ncbi:YugN family protein [Chungangia koreensis]|uniref:YugN family protein n=1 Tax=Chungangia koreensis TaxID=752657 RepID=A0ABV8X602_9LACT